MESWKSEGIDTYSKSLQDLLGVTKLENLPKSENPNISYDTTKCGIQKCTHVRGIFNISEGIACVNHLGMKYVCNLAESQWLSGRMSACHAKGPWFDPH